MKVELSECNLLTTLFEKVNNEEHAYTIKLLTIGIPAFNVHVVIQITWLNAVQKYYCLKEF